MKMDVSYIDISGNNNIGVAVLATDKFILVPDFIDDKTVKVISKTLHVEVTKISETIIGSLAVANSNGLVVSNVVKQEVIDQIAELSIPVYQSKEFFAFGNITLANDYGAFVSPIVPEKIKEEMTEVLGVPIQSGTIARSDLVGSLAYVTNDAGLVTPLASDQDISKIKEVLSLKEVEVGSINRGSEFVATGMVANKYGVIVGNDTTGIEIMQISRCFDI